MDPTPRLAAGSRGAFRNNFYLYRQAWSLAPWRVLGEWLRAFLDYAGWVFFSVVFVRYLLWSLEQRRGEVVLFVAITMAGFGLAAAFTAWFDRCYRPYSGSRLYTAYARVLFAKARTADLARYEDPDFYNSYTLAVKEAAERMDSVVRNIPSIAAGVASALSVALSMGAIDPLVLLFILFPVVGNFVFGKRLNTLAWQRDKEVETHRRKLTYADRVMYQPEYAKELRLSDIRVVLQAIMDSGYAGMMEAFRRLGPPAVRANFVKNICSFLFVFEGVFLYGSWLALVRHSITASAFAVLASGVVSASWMIIILSDAVLETIKNGLYIDNLRTFLETEATIQDARPDARPVEPFRELRFEGVGFAYRGQTRLALEGLNFTLRRGEKVALVGVNGAGKTSLIKLLMRLYDPVAGRILYNGTDLRELALTPYRRLFATAFQDWRIFSLTVAGNVLMRQPAGQADYDRVRTALEDSGAWPRVARLDQGMDTVLTREFDDTGAVLSGGEYQKIAIARAFARDFEIALLDEPSSALDPVAEYQLYESIMRRCADRTVVFISHRLSSATLADRILVLDGGRIVEEGRHQDLLKAGGAYAAMFRLQAENYVKDNWSTLGEEA